MKTVSVDRDACISCAACWLLCPGVFIREKRDEKSSIQPRLRSGDRLGEGTVPTDLEGYAAEAAQACPVHVITLLDGCKPIPSSPLDQRSE